MSSCSCEYGNDIYEETKRKARKEHKCISCKDIIQKGEEYWYISMLFEGSWDNLKICECCMLDAKNLFDLGYCVDWLDLDASIREAYRV